MNKQNGFTIVELLVVIVVIGILAAITIVSYTGLSKKAIVASLQSDLSNASVQFKLYDIEYGSYPTAITETSVDSRVWCAAAPAADSKYCLNLSGSNLKHSYIGSGSSFKLVARNGTNFWSISESSGVAETNLSPIISIAAITGTTEVHYTLTAGAISPVGANGFVTYQWQRSDAPGGTYVDIVGATTSMYKLVTADANMYIKVIATGAGDYYDSAVSAASAKITPSSWFAGIAATAMADKFVYKADQNGFGIYKFRSSAGYLVSPQGAAGLDPSYPSFMSLVSPQTYPSVDFSLYPAQSSCKSIGGRLPNVPELLAIYNNKASYGGNYYSNYWSATTDSYNTALSVDFGVGSVGSYFTKTSDLYVRCVKG